MRLGVAPPRLIQLAFVGMLIVFVVHAIVFFVWTAPSLLHSDSATEILLTVEALKTKTPLVRSFYYVNGDFFIFGSHWFAAPLILLMGASPQALFATNAFGLVVEVMVLSWGFFQLSGSVLRSVFASIVCLFAWSTLHLYFAYAELTYGLFATIHFTIFVLYAKLLAPAAPEDAPFWKSRRSLFIWSLALFFFFAVQNPLRATSFDLAPILAGCLWRWNDSSRGERLKVAKATAAVWGLSFLVHRFVLRALVTPAVQAGMGLSIAREFPLGVLKNIGILIRGLGMFIQPRDDVQVSVVVGGLVLVGAITWVSIYTLRKAERHTYSLMRFVCLVILAELTLVGGLLTFGDLLSSNPSTTRYLMPSLIPLLGLGCLVATGPLSTGSARSSLPVSATVVAAWICLLPVDATVAASRRLFGPREVYPEADPSKLQRVSDELVRRQLSHGFATYWNANAMTLLSKRSTITCGVDFGDGVTPKKWLVGTECFDKTRLPQQIYFVAHVTEREEAHRAYHGVLPPSIDQFTIDDYEVSVFRTAECSLAWLDLPLPRKKR